MAISSIKLSRKKALLGILSGILIITSLGLSYYLTQEEKGCLEKAGAYAIGQIEDIFIYKGKTIKAYFWVDGKKYLASDKAYDAQDPVKVGDRFYIHYCIENPKNNSILFDRRVQKRF